MPCLSKYQMGRDDANDWTSFYPNQGDDVLRLVM